MASHVGTIAMPGTSPRLCACCGRAVFTLGPRIPDDMLAFCSLVCWLEGEVSRNG